MNLSTYLNGTDVLIAGMSSVTDDEVIDRVAAVCHEQWRYWAAFMLDNPGEEPRFRQLLATDFADLDDSDKDADRHWARLMLSAVRGKLDCRSGNRPDPPSSSAVVGGAERFNHMSSRCR